MLKFGDDLYRWVCTKMVKSIPGLALFVLILVLGLSSCSSTSWSYRNLDWLLPWYYDDYIEFDTQQSPIVKQRIQQRLRWHCREQLPRQIHWLQQVRDDALNQPSAEQLDWHLQQALRFWREFTLHLSEDALLIGKTLRREQWDQLFARLQVDNRVFRREFVSISDAEFQQKRAESMVKGWEYWLDELNDTQRATIKRWSESLTILAAQSLWSRNDWQTALRQVMLAEAVDAEKLAGIRVLLTQPQIYWTEDYRSKIKGNRQLSAQLILAVLQQMTPAQREHLNARFYELIQSLEAIDCADLD